MNWLLLIFEPILKRGYIAQLEFQNFLLKCKIETMEAQRNLEIAQWFKKYREKIERNGD